MPQPRRTQQDRSNATRTALLDATLTCLVDRGYRGTTTSAVAAAAGVSRGAQLHHFGTKDALVAEAVAHLARKRLDLIESAIDSLPRDHFRPRRALELLADTLSGPLYAAAVELWIAARSDGELRRALIPVEHSVTARLREFCFAYITSDPVLTRLTLDLLLGRGVGELLLELAEVDRDKALDAWADFLTADPGQPARAAAAPPKPAEQ